MPSLRPTPDARRPAQPRPRNSGSAIILVVISVILLALLGATYLQITRFERLANPEQGNIETVLQSIITKAATTLGEDIVKTNDLAFNPAEFIEPYDYDWVRDVGLITTTPINNSDTGVGGAGAVNALEEDLDDPWLASAYLTGGLYRNITNLCGYFIDIDTNDDGNADDPGNLNFVRTQQADIAPQVIASAGFNVTSEFADTDDDGITDARWAWPPIFEIGGIKYVFAIRMIDLSARVNANTAQALVDAAGGRGVSALQAPRGSDPTDISLAGLANDVFGGGARDDVFDLLQFRYGAAGPLPRPYESVTPDQYDRLAFWENGASRLRADGVSEPEANFNGTPITYQPLPLLDTIELLTRNGLSDGANTSTIEGADVGGGTLDALLRATTDESGLTADTFTGGTAGFFTTDARKWLTTHSGVGDFAMPMNAGDPLERLHNPNASEVQEMADALRGLFTGGSLGALPSGMAFDDFTDHLAASASDFADLDNQPTLVGTRAGFEPLPMLTEAYQQIPYNWQSTDGSGLVTMLYLNDTTIGYAIEIGNPFNATISLENIRLEVNGQPWGTSLSDLAGGKTELLAGELLVFYRNSDAQDSDAAVDDIDSRIAASAAPTTVTKVAITQDWPGVFTLAHGDTDVPVELVVEAEDGTPITYSRINMGSLTDSKSINTWVPANPPEPNGGDPVRYFVESQQGNGNGLNMLHVTAAEMQTARLLVEVDGDYTAATNSDLGEPGKRAGGGNGDLGTLDAEQAIIRDVEGMDYTGDLAFILGVGPTTTQTLPEVWANQGSLAAHRLPGPGAGVKDPAVDALNVDYLTLAMARLSTVAPFRDGLDNNSSDGADDEAENFIPGKINVNTAPRFLIESTLPFENAGLRVAVAAAIEDMRDDIAAAGRTRNNRGLAYLGELFNRPSITTAGGTPGGDGNDNLTWDGTMPLDWNNADANGDGIADTLDGFIDDLDEELLLVKLLPQMYSTRSDVYAAYILINGYDGATLTETLRAIVIFQRADVRNGGDLAEVLAVFRL